MPSTAVHILPLLRSFEHTISDLCGDASFPSSDLRRLFSKLKAVAKAFSTNDFPVCINWEWGNEEEATPCVWTTDDLYTSISGYTKFDLFSIVINRHGNILGNRKYEMDGATLRDPVFASHVSLASDNSVVFYFYSTQFFVYYKGCMVEHLPNIFKESDIRGATNKYSYEAKDYSNLIREHFSDYVENEQVTKHWQNRKDRILRPAPEAIFRDSLWKFLEENVVDAILVQKEQVIKGTTSKVDISIQTVNSSYLIEIKWLGRASKKDSTGTSNGLKRALAGARQVIRYIEMSKGEIVKGILVMYDARENNEDIPWGDKESHHLLDRNFRLWLRSDSASQA
ncbi:hypothetical protein [Paenibacillus faecalis]|uniref:hypothetical protein n=1 Tax=Paenibacillus faecalis TaxID=2079532 RepID=UPI000D105243|nr:hypothetical protein [Paenibacillus faecalis]